MEMGLRQVPWGWGQTWLSSRVVVEKMEKGLCLFNCLLYLLADFPILDGRYGASFACLWLGRLTKLWLPLSSGLLYNLLSTLFFCFICDSILLWLIESSWCAFSPTQSIGLLSYTFLRSTGKEDIVVPMVNSL